MPDAVLDFDRLSRTGVTEAVFCSGKTPAQIDYILGQARAADRPMLLTRLEADLAKAISFEYQTHLDYDPLSRTAIFGTIEASPLKGGAAIVTAGTSDLAIAHEAARTLRFHGFDASIFADVGVAGLWRLQQRLDELRRFRVVIAIAGLEGALFSVLGGLVAAPVIAVPSSIGYGVSAGGTVALQSALASCAPGVVAVNIDNGFGAACAAIAMMNMASRALGQTSQGALA
jgi:NCAIR mutase (PurE)-related protein